MARIRIPFPWEDQPDPLEKAGSADPRDFLVLPEVKDVPPEDRPRIETVTYGKGEVRRGMDGLQRRLREAGFSSEYAREQAQKVAPKLAANGGRA